MKSFQASGFLLNNTQEKFEIITVARTTKLLFWVVMPRGLIGRYQNFGETYCSLLQG
jgi:hypothetical protein